MIPDLRFYDFEFNLLHIAHDCISSIWSPKFNDIGTFEAHFPIKSDIVNALFDKKYVVAVQDGKQAIITGVQIENEFVIFGRSINYLLSKKVTPSFEKKETVSNMCIDFVNDAFKGVENIFCNANEESLEEFDFKKETYSLTSDVIRECLEKCGGGHNMEFDVKNKRWVFNVLSGHKVPYVLSEDNKTAYDLTYTLDMLSFANKGYLEKQIEDDEESKTEWVLIDNDETKTGIYAFYTILSGETEEDAKKDLKSKEIKNETALTVKELKYNKDYFLGDTFTVEYIIGNFKKKTEKKVVGIDIVYENNLMTEKPIFEEVL